MDTILSTHVKMGLLWKIREATRNRSYLPAGRFPPQLVEEVQQHHDLKILLGRFRGFHGHHHGHALAVSSEIPTVRHLPQCFSRRGGL
jgi:hypothetical protein